MKKYYYYDVFGGLETDMSFVKLISEKPLPEFSRKHKGCSIKGNDIPTDIPIGKKIKVAFGDPRVFDCSVMSFSECITKSEKIKKIIHLLATAKQSKPITLLYKGGRIWTTHRYLCLVEDLK